MNRSYSSKTAETPPAAARIITKGKYIIRFDCFQITTIDRKTKEKGYKVSRTQQLEQLKRYFDFAILSFSTLYCKFQKHR